ncbi:STAS domain-containing protein [Micromonospora sp. D93]|uniref:STAS domain-containing protein n=1 Tax=Micromonospora sp. D93 TaxID=2824886 RepID=UPI001B3798E9|nr:STAS domain-containing protein [Micromonospora sp. D93]MBQ1021372.1 STAS domain-containing protein [Micromonospora sp. D93]
MHHRSGGLAKGGRADWRPTAQPIIVEVGQAMRQSCYGFRQEACAPMTEPSWLFQTHLDRSSAAVSLGQVTQAALVDSQRDGRLDVDGAGPSFQVTRYTEPTNLSATISADRMVVAPVGYVDMDTAPRLATALMNAIDSHPEVCCDLTGVGFFSAAGVYVLLLARDQAERVGSRFSIRGAEGITQRVLRITGVERLLLSPEQTAGPNARLG